MYIHHHSTGGGTFSVRRSASDGRQRLQICHSPPFHVPVESAETSALRAMMQDSQAARSRRNSGQVAAASPSAISTARSGGGGVLSSVPSTLTAAASRIGSKSLSTTPTRELLAGTSPSRYEFVAQKTA
uniref:Uncharacterized protein n=1 Tax=Romanomermis culicivorax TaxID=13658 RepID=A0A915JEI6_ROMCU